MSKAMQCNFFDIFGLTSDDNYYKSRISLQDKDNYYPKDSIFRFDDRIFGDFICFYEDKELIIESIKRRKLDDIYSFKIKDDYSKEYPIFIKYFIEKNLYRFAEKKWIKKAYLEGNFKIKPSIDYMKKEYDIARQDNEHLISEKLANATMTINSRTVPVTNAEKNYIDCDINKYIFCMSYEFDKRLFDEFKPKNDAEMACLVITDPKELERRLLNEIKNYSIIGTRVYYNNQIHRAGPLLNKNRQFIVQKEFRFILYDLNNPIECNSNEIINEKKEILNRLPYEYIDINLGSLADISFVIDSEGKRLCFDE